MADGFTPTLSVETLSNHRSDRRAAGRSRNATTPPASGRSLLRGIRAYMLWEVYNGRTTTRSVYNGRTTTRSVYKDRKRTGQVKRVVNGGGDFMGVKRGFLKGTSITVLGGGPGEGEEVKKKLGNIWEKYSESLMG